MFIAGISRNHDNRTSLPPSLIRPSLMLLSLRNRMSARSSRVIISVCHTFFTCLTACLFAPGMESWDHPES